MNISEALAKEIKRSQELLLEYRKIPNGAGFFGAWMIQASVDNAVNALASGDVIKILEAYEVIKDNE